MKDGKYNIAVVGATGAVGIKMLEVIEKRKFPVGEITLLASENSAGKKIRFRKKLLQVRTLNQDSFRNIDIALFSAGAGISRDYAGTAVNSGAVVIDNSSYYRNDPDVPLVVPEINPEDIFKHKGIISNPNCTTAIMLTALYPVYRTAGIKKIIVSTYQSVSGAGMRGVSELEDQVKAISLGLKPDVSKFPHKIAYNLIPQIDTFTADGYTKEEKKMLNETRKILHDGKIKVSSTCVRVPVRTAHSMAVTFTTGKYIPVDEVRRLLSVSEGIRVLDDPEKLLYPMPVNSEGNYDCFAGRIRKDIALRNGISMWVCGDQLLKGAALNAVQIAEKLIANLRTA